MKSMQTLGTKPVSVPLPLSSALNSSDRSSCSAALCRYTSSCAKSVPCRHCFGLALYTGQGRASALIQLQQGRFIWRSSMSCSCVFAVE